MSLSDSLMRAVGAVYQGAWRKAVVAVVVIVACLIGVQWGLPGVAVAVNASLLVRYLLMGQLAIKITNATVREFIFAHGPGALLALLVTGTTLLIVLSMRSADLPDIVVLTGGAIGSMAVSIGMLLAYPRILGRDGSWMLGQIINRMPRQNTRIIQFASRKLGTRR